MVIESLTFIISYFISEYRTDSKEMKPNVLVALVGASWFDDVQIRILPGQVWHGL